MALIIIENMEEFRKAQPSAHYHLHVGSRQDVQREFCGCMELGGEDCFQNPEVKEYLEGFDIYYKGNYMMASEEWGGEMFVTYLNYPLQLACLALYRRKMLIVVEAESGCYEPKFLIPILKKRDVYVLDDNFEDWLRYCKTAENGVEVRVAGRSSAEMTAREFDSFLNRLACRWTSLTREVDAEVFPADYREKYLFEPTQTTLADYLRRYGEKEENIARVPDIPVLVNGKNNFTGTFRNYPIHALFYIEEKWWYAGTMSVKYPTLGELLEDAVFCDKAGGIVTDVSAAGKVFVLVLDGDAIFDVRRYWENVAFVAKYDKAGGVLEICDIGRGVLEFHELLQQSGDLGHSWR